MKKINIITSDLDGTLLNYEGRLSNESKDTINKLINSDILFIPCTARGHNDLPKDLLDLDIRYYVCANGAVIYDNFLDKVIKEYLLDVKDAINIISNLNKDEIYINIVNNGEVMSEKRLIEDFRRNNIFSLDVLNHFTSTRTIVESTYDILKNLDYIEKLHMNFFSKDIRDKNRDLITANERYTISTSDDLNLEITNSKSDKGLAALYICDLLNIESKNIIAFGDNLNDIPLFNQAKYKVAMINGHEELKSIATHISEYSNNESGVVKFIEENILS